MMSQELFTLARYNMHVLTVVFTNETLGYIEAEQRDESNQPLSGVIIPDNDWAKVAEGMNMKAFTVHDKAEFQAAVEEWKKMDGPAFIDVKYTKHMAYSTELNTLDDPEFVKYYHAEALHPFSYFAEKFGLEIDAASGASSHSEDKADALQVQSTTSASSPETAPDASSGASY